MGDTDLWIEVEKDFTVYGEEMIFGGGKTIRDGMGQNGRITGKDGALDLVITNVVLLDYTGIVKADVGVKDGRIVGVGKAEILISWMESIRTWSSERGQR